MTCPSCEHHVERALRSAGATDATADFRRNEVVFAFAGEPDETSFKEAVKSSGYTPGVMQVLPSTGKNLGVGDIKLAEPNVHAGVKYIRLIIDRYYANEPMDEMNKILFAFAAYNAGPTRIAELRGRAKRQGLDPNVWFDNVEFVAAERIGRETVQYVKNIYKYYIAYKLLEESRLAKQAVKQSVNRKGR